MLSQHDLDCDKLDFIAKPSQEALPSLPKDNMDLVIIDGDHAFPASFIDWYYTADRVTRGGYFVVDDTQIPTGALLRSFLSSERLQWRRVVDIDKTAIFQRTTGDQVAAGVLWMQQPFCKVPKTKTILRRLVNRVHRLGA